MNDGVALDVLAKNQDLLRGSLETLDQEAIVKAFLWLNGEGSFPYPSSIHLDLTLRCSARCAHCMQWAWPDHAELTLSQLKQLFEVFSSWGVKTITFGGGNPLLHDHFIPAIKMACEAKMEVGIISEGMEMSSELASAICKYGRWIRFSLDGPTPEIHDSIRNAPGLFNLVLSCIESLQAVPSPLLIGLNCVVQKKNVSSLAGMTELAERIGVDTLLFKIPHGDDPNSRFLPSINEWRMFVEWIHATADKKSSVRNNLKELSELLAPVFLEEDVVAGRPVREFYKRINARCFAPFFFLVCDSEGNAYPCDYLQADTRQWGGKYVNIRNEFRLGNILEDSQGVIDRLASMMRERVHRLPGCGYDECGCCTRFFQLNAALTSIDDGLKNLAVDRKTVRERIAQVKNEGPGASFL
ncbi:MAG TPA: radical SAM protein [Blastocatellia bacterium]|nr:radical SAM protein [Blastocatellia bacterium]